jgi:hypothetical protein
VDASVQTTISRPCIPGPADWMIVNSCACKNSVIILSMVAVDPLSLFFADRSSLCVNCQLVASAESRVSCSKNLRPHAS